MDAADVKRLTIELPLPPDVLHPNGRTRNHGYRASLVRKTRTDAYYAAVAALEGKHVCWPAVTVKATFYMPRKRDGDGLNAWIKSSIDGALQDSGIVANDSAVTLLPPSQVTGKEAGRKVVLTITPLEQ